MTLPPLPPRTRLESSVSEVIYRTEKDGKVDKDRIQNTITIMFQKIIDTHANSYFKVCESSSEGQYDVHFYVLSWSEMDCLKEILYKNKLNVADTTSVFLPTHVRELTNHEFVNISEIHLEATILKINNTFNFVKSQLDKKESDLGDADYFEIMKEIEKQNYNRELRAINNLSKETLHLLINKDLYSQEIECLFQKTINNYHGYFETARLGDTGEYTVCFCSTFNHKSFQEHLQNEGLYPQQTTTHFLNKTIVKKHIIQQEAIICFINEKSNIDLNNDIFQRIIRKIGLKNIIRANEALQNAALNKHCDSLFKKKILKNLNGFASLFGGKYEITKISDHWGSYALCLIGEISLIEKEFKKKAGENAKIEVEEVENSLELQHKYQLTSEQTYNFVIKLLNQSPYNCEISAEHYDAVMAGIAQ